MQAFVKIINLFLGLLVMIGGAFLVGMAANQSNEPLVPTMAALVRPAETEEFFVYSYPYGAEEVFTTAYEHIRNLEPARASSAVVAHHLVVADKMAELFTRIGSPSTKTVVLISPNHFDLGYSPMQVSRGAWDTPFGRVLADDDLVDDLVRRVEGLEVEEQTFEAEHGISAITPFIGKSFPNAKVVPIVLHDSISEEQVQSLIDGILEEAPKAMVIASIDMSHNLPLAPQVFHDHVTMKTLESNAWCPECEIDLETDTNAVFQVLYGVNEARETETWTQTHHGSSLAMGATSDWRQNTSHIMGFYSDGSVEPDAYAALQFVGDIMLDRGVRLKLNEFGVQYPWEEMTRFLRGTHRVIGNLEGTVNEQESTYTYNPPFRFVFSPESVEEMGKYVDVVSLANNHTSDVGSAGQVETKERLTGMGIEWFGSYATPVPRYDEDVNGLSLTYIGYHQFQPAVEELKAEIQQAKADGRFVIVLPHWGAEYIRTPQTNQRALAEIMVEAGADLIVGGHPHVPQGIEVIDGVLVVYSLGNFIFDQQIPATWEAITVGAIIEEETLSLYLQPVYTRDGQPVPLSDDDTERLLGELAALSTPSIQTDIQSGIITMPYGNANQ